MEVAINSMRSKLENTIKHRMEDVLSYVDQKTQGLSKELIEKIDKIQVDLQAVKTSLNTRTKGFQEAITTTKADLITDLNLFHIEAQATRTEAVAHQRNMEAKPEAIRREIQSQFGGFEAGAERGRGPGALGTCFLWSIILEEALIYPNAMTHLAS
jgi:molecular chaperone GrpE (heat shock protein)